MAGQIINRGDRKWLVRVFLGRDPNSGKREYYNQTVHGVKQDAQDVLVDLLKDKNVGKLTIGLRTRVIGDLLDNVVRDYRINGQDADWAELVIRHLRPMFGKMPISKIRPGHIDRYIDERRALGRANATINHELSMLRRAFNLAKRKGVIGVVPCLIPKLEENNVRKGFFTHEEFVRLRTELPSELKPVITFAYYTGCRKGEVLSLQWSQVDLVGRTVRLEPGETKNDQPRLIPLHVDELFQVVAMQRLIRDQHHSGCPWVFNRQGHRILDFRKTWDVACERAELWDPAKNRPTRLFHDLRRTGVRNLIRAGVPEKVAMLISGHKTRSIFERYNIVDERDVIDAMTKLNTYTKERSAAEKSAAKKHSKGTQPNQRHTPGTQAPGKPN